MRSAKVGIVWDCLRGATRLFGGCSETARLFEREGLVASITPRTPDRSMFNAVVPDDLDALARAYDELARTYRDAGVRAFTVWVDEGDEATKRFLKSRGHARDSITRGMLGDLASMRLDDASGLDCRETRDVALVARLNDAAYGLPPPAFAAAIARLPSDEWRAWEARLDGRPTTCLLTWYSPLGDVGVCAVATLPEARGRGVASRLLSHALRSARARGMKTTSLQASPKGKGVYARLGYEDLAAIEMWEHRAALAPE